MHLSSVSILHIVSYALRFLSFRKILLPTRMTCRDTSRNKEWNMTPLSPGVFNHVVTKEVRELACSLFKRNWNIWTLEWRHRFVFQQLLEQFMASNNGSRGHSKRISFYALTLLFKMSRYRTFPLHSMESMSVCSPI